MKKWLFCMFWLACFCATAYVMYLYGYNWGNPEYQYGILAWCGGIAIPVSIFVWLPMFGALAVASFAKTGIGKAFSDYQMGREIEQVKYGIYH